MRKRHHSSETKSPLNPQLAALLPLLDETMLPDRRALRQALQRAGDPPALAAWRVRVDAARTRYAARAARVPEIRVDESLPIAANADEIVRLIRAHQVIVLAGETGSGKSTQLPKL